MAHTNSSISIITLNMSELSTLIKRQRFSDCNKNKETQLNYKLFIGDRFKDT